MSERPPGDERPAPLLSRGGGRCSPRGGSAGPRRSCSLADPAVASLGGPALSCLAPGRRSVGMARPNSTAQFRRAHPSIRAGRRAEVRTSGFLTERKGTPLCPAPAREEEEEEEGERSEGDRNSGRCHMNLTTEISMVLHSSNPKKVIAFRAFNTKKLYSMILDFTRVPCSGRGA